MVLTVLRQARIVHSIDSEAATPGSVAGDECKAPECNCLDACEPGGDGRNGISGLKR